MVLVSGWAFQPVHPTGACTSMQVALQEHIYVHERGCPGRTYGSSLAEPAS